MAITPDTFKIRFPEFEDISNDRIQLFIEDSKLIMNESHWGDVYDLAQANLTAHFLSLANSASSGNTSVSGPVSSRSVDGTSITYTNDMPNSQLEMYFSSTVYGLKYITLLKTLGVAAASV